MFRNRLWRGLFTALLILILVGTVGVFAYQMGAAQGLGAGLAEGEGPARIVHYGYGFFPFFWGFGLIKFFFLLFLGLFILRLIFRPWRRMAPGGHWKGGRGPWGERLKELHDQWHAEHPEEDHGDAPAG